MSPLTLNRITVLGTGTLAMLVFGALCIRHNVPAIEADLLMRATEQLQAKRMGWAEVGVDGRDLTLSGVAPDTAALQAAIDSAAVYGARTVTSTLTTIDDYVSADLPTTSPAPENAADRAPAERYRTRFQVTDDGLVIEGVAPDEASRRRIVRAAQDRFGVAAVEARVEVRAGQPPGWEQAAEAAVEIAQQLVIGEVAMTDATISVTGLTGSESSEEVVAAVLAGQLPANYAATSETGSRAELEAVLRTSPQLAARLERSERRRDGGAVRALTTLDPATCEQRFRDSLATGSILFATASDQLTDTSQQLLETLGSVLKLCPQTRVTIAGHTDDQGLLENNLALSQRRAEAVMQFLVTQGISLSRLSARGYGEERPLVENRTAEDRAINRRIEFLFDDS